MPLSQLLSGVGGSVWGVEQVVGAGSPFRKGNIMAVYGDGECLDGPEGCTGETFARSTLSGSGDAYYRCDGHYDAYVERVQPRMDDIRRRYPVTAPADFDPTYAGERWDEDDW